MWLSKIIRTKANKQLKGVKRIGGFVDVLSYTMFWMSLVNFTFNSITTYTVTRSYTLEALPWLNIWIFFSVVFLLVSTVMFMEYKIIYPSRIAFRNQQEYAHDSPIKKDLDQLKEENTNLKRDLSLIKEKLGIEVINKCQKQ